MSVDFIACVLGSIAAGFTYGLMSAKRVPNLDTLIRDCIVLTGSLVAFSDGALMMRDGQFLPGIILTTGMGLVSTRYAVRRCSNR